MSDRAEAEQERGDVEADCIRVSATRPYTTGATHYVTQERHINRLNAGLYIATCVGPNDRIHRE